jgi:predicted PurR-regulated permease PerM
LIWAAVTGLAVAALVALVVALFWGAGKVLGLLSPVLWPLAIAGVIAYLLDPVVDFIERRGVPRTRAILCVFALALVTATGLIGSIVPQIVVETRDLAGRIPAYVTKVELRIEKWVSEPPAFVQRLMHLGREPGGTNSPAPALDLTNHASLTNHSILTNPLPAAHELSNAADSHARANLTNLVELARSYGIELDPKLFTSATGWLAGAAKSASSWMFGQAVKVASWFGVIVGLFLVPIYAFYFLLEKRGIESKWTTYLPLAESKLKDELAFVLGSINDYLIAFFRGQVLVAICDGIMYGIGFSLIGLPYAILLGVAAVVLTIIPYIGAAVVLVSSLAIALVQYGDWLHPLLALGVYAVVQLIEGFVIQPKIMGDRVGLHPLTIIIAMMVGTTLLGGILGAMLAIPLTAVLRVVMFRYVWTARPLPGTEKT